MKIFLWVLFAATVIGGFIGGEMLDTIFSITGAVIGGVGTGAALLGLGAYFNSQEEKSDKLPPEMREIFDRMITGKESPTKNEIDVAKKRYLKAVQTKAADKQLAPAKKLGPFYANKNADERRNWFSQVPPWRKINPKLINEIIAKFGDDPLFEVFVITSMELRLVDQYEILGREGYVEGIGCSQVSGILYMAGDLSFDAIVQLMQAPQLDKKKIGHHYEVIRNTFEPAILLDDNQIMAYRGLAIVSALLNKTEDALYMARHGLEKVRAMKSKNTPYHLSKIKAVSDMPKQLEEIESAFENMIQKLTE